MVARQRMAALSVPRIPCRSITAGIARLSVVARRGSLVQARYRFGQPADDPALGPSPSLASRTPVDLERQRDAQVLVGRVPRGAIREEAGRPDGKGISRPAPPITCPIIYIVLFLNGRSGLLGHDLCRLWGTRLVAWRSRPPGTALRQRSDPAGARRPGAARAGIGERRKPGDAGRAGPIGSGAVRMRRTGIAPAAANPGRPPGRAGFRKRATRPSMGTDSAGVGSSRATGPARGSGWRPRSLAETGPWPDHGCGIRNGAVAVGRRAKRSSRPASENGRRDGSGYGFRKPVPRSAREGTAVGTDLGKSDAQSMPACGIDAASGIHVGIRPATAVDRGTAWRDPGRRQGASPCLDPLPAMADQVAWAARAGSAAGWAGGGAVPSRK